MNIDMNDGFVFGVGFCLAQWFCKIVGFFILALMKGIANE
jgi:hypothetical protein